MALNIDAYQPNRQLIVGDESSNILKDLNTLFQFSAFGIAFTMKQVLTVKLIADSKRTRTEKVKSNLRQYVFKFQSSSIWNHQPADKEMRIFDRMFVFVEVAEMHTNLVLRACAARCFCVRLDVVVTRHGCNRPVYIHAL